ncbi:hypothetical protein I7I51_05607 [Histoplasma capsulatum]|uniref:Uncharacterized protein n=1 Tax=Ajellomyces capsulatus TaxID=5037 RepID=A0A8A1M864_AJECA|nr:hypothetical protein I7I51_05607 [Histoplasma capsulatum]
MKKFKSPKGKKFRVPEMKPPWVARNSRCGPTDCPLQATKVTSKPSRHPLCAQFPYSPPMVLWDYMGKKIFDMVADGLMRESGLITFAVDLGTKLDSAPTLSNPSLVAVYFHLPCFNNVVAAFPRFSWFSS